MSDSISPLPLPDLLRFVLRQVRVRCWNGNPDDLFFTPSPMDPFHLERYKTVLDNPIGVAAGPHTQLVLNIITAWLYGARYLELKTVQVLDELHVAKPCIDMSDEGYNCEWSQELKITESFREYFNAWIIIHILQHELGFEGSPGMIFNMSVGYDFQGIMHDKVQWFLGKMSDCSAELHEARDILYPVWPEIGALEIPSRISDSMTLSTMHGCPPREIGKIARYLVCERGLHTTIKLNPTLLGPVELRSILNDCLHFRTEVPDQAFDHDLKYPEAQEIIDSLSQEANRHQVSFGVKLSNTLECINRQTQLASSEKMAYLSGRALHPVTVNLARKLKQDRPDLEISFSGGVDCFNLPEVISCGLVPATACSDLLKPGGYGRLHQYIGNLRAAFEVLHAGNIPEYISTTAKSVGYSGADPALFNLKRYAEKVLADPRYQKEILPRPSVKTTRFLDFFDCIHAPCAETCCAEQPIPQYLAHTAKGAFGEAFDTILKTNPFPSVMGAICDHLCEYKCVRVNYDEPLQIKGIKKFIAEKQYKLMSSDHTSSVSRVAGQVGSTIGETPPQVDSEVQLQQGVIHHAAIIGAGPAGLTCGWYLRQAGFDVDIYDQNRFPGGMIAAVIPLFRLESRSVGHDVDTILGSGIRFHGGERIDKGRLERLLNEYDAVFLAAGAQVTVPLQIEGITADGVLDPLDFLSRVRQGRPDLSGSRFVVIGGGNTAVDVARTANRLVTGRGDVTLVYRRTLQEMPADREEIATLISEGIKIVELITPERIITENGRVIALVCSRNILVKTGDQKSNFAGLGADPVKDHRPVPVKIPGSDFELPCDIIIPALGQKPELDFLDPELLKTSPGSYATRIGKLYLGGDALRGASTAVNAIADGRKAAEEIILRIINDNPEHTTVGVERKKVLRPGIGPEHYRNLMRNRALRVFGPAGDRLNNRKSGVTEGGFSITTDEDAREEASRCLQCQELCNLCVTVCPNLANFSYQTDPVVFQLKKAVCDIDGAISIITDHEFRIEQSFQILNIRDWCNECGNCHTFCPSAGTPFIEKPGLCLSPATLNLEGSGFFLSRLPGKEVLIYRDREHIKTLICTGRFYEYETDQVRARFNTDTFDLVDVQFLTPCIKEAHFDFAAQMSIIMQGARQFFRLIDPPS